MAVKFLIHRTLTPLNPVSHLLQPRFPNPISVSRFLGTLHSLVSREWDYRKSYPPNSRGLASEASYDVEVARVTYRAVDNRVPATVITGFLGSGKVSFFILLFGRLFYFQNR